MTISIDAEKPFDKIQHPFMRTLSKVGIQGAYLNIIKVINKKSTANINSQQTKNTSFPPKIRNKTECLLSPLLFNIVLEVLATAIRKRNKRHPYWKRRSKTVIVCNDMVIYIENHIEFTPINLVSQFSKTAGYKVNIYKSKAFLYTKMKYQKQKLGITPIYYSHKKNKVPRNKLNQRGGRPVLRKLPNTEEGN